MQRFKDILIVVEDNTLGKTLLAQGAALARRNRARLTVAVLVEAVTYEPSRLVSAGTVAEPPVPIIEKPGQPLEQLISSLRQKEIEVEANVLSGTPFLEIIRAVIRNRHDLVMIMAGGEGGLKEKLFGGTPMQLLRKCPCPVWVMKPTHPRPYRRILTTVDPDPFDQERHSLNKTIMELSTSLAQLEQSELHIVHAWTLFGEAILRGPRGNLSKQEMYRLLSETRQKQESLLNDSLLPYGLNKLKHRVHLLKGEPGRVISEVAQAQGIDLIVMGTVCRTGIAGLLIGNTAETVLRQVDCAVLAVKPEGFVSPVGLVSKMMA